MAASSPRISVYSLADLKSTSDDALPNYLNSLKFEQSHLVTDVRLGLGYAAVAVAAATFYYDYNFGWDMSKTYTLWAVVLYFAFTSALTAWVWAVERGRVYQGSNEDTRLSISSSITKHTPMYRLLVEVSGSSPGQAIGSSVKQIEAPFTRWFSEDGHFISKPFQDWLSSEIPAVQHAAARQR